MNILFVGDIVGRPGRSAFTHLLPDLVAEYDAQFVIANGENAAAGYGVTRGTVTELLNGGADCLTTGNHVWAQKESFVVVENEYRLLRPANYPPGAPGLGARIYETHDGHRIGVVNLIGRIFMDPLDCPFRVGDQIVAELGDQTSLIVVDFHAEATSEKMALARYLDGRVTAVIGTHTHVQTADERILSRGTAFISDAGMTGPTETVIGVEPETVIRKFIGGLPAKFEVPKSGPTMLCGVVVTADPKTGRALKIERMQRPYRSAAEDAKD
jgi:2',3'-cyclic-nucleotide 2'-phosphodiesterase